VNKCAISKIQDGRHNEVCSSANHFFNRYSLTFSEIYGFQNIHTFCTNSMILT